MDKLQFDVKIEYNDVKTYALYEARRKTSFRVLKVIGIVYTVCCFLIFLLSPKYFWTVGIGAIIVVMMIFIWLPYRIRKRSRDNFATEKGYSAPINYIIDDHEVMAKGNLFEGKFSWDKIHEVREIKSMFLLYTNRLSAVIIPKRSLSETDLATFRAILAKQKNINLKLLQI